jgi:hypothetical protein
MKDEKSEPIHICGKLSPHLSKRETFCPPRKMPGQLLAGSCRSSSYHKSNPTSYSSAHRSATTAHTAQGRPGDSSTLTPPLSPLYSTNFPTTQHLTCSIPITAMTCFILDTGFQLAYNPLISPAPAKTFFRLPPSGRVCYRRWSAQP